MHTCLQGWTALPALAHLQGPELPQGHPVLPFCASHLVSSSGGHSPLEDAGGLESDAVTSTYTQGQVFLLNYWKQQRFIVGVSPFSAGRPFHTVK